MELEGSRRKSGIPATVTVCRLFCSLGVIKNSCVATINHFQASPHDHLPQPKQHVLLLLPGLSQRKTARTREPFEKQGGSTLQPGFRRVRKRLHEKQKRRGVHSSDQKRQGEQGRGVELSHPGAPCPAAFRLWLPPAIPLESG